jgi:PhnB protein
MATRAKARQKKKSAARRPPARVKPIPAGYHTVTAYLTVRDAARTLEFYRGAFGAAETVRMPGPDGKSVMHAEMKIGDSIVMLSDEFPGMSTEEVPPKAMARRAQAAMASMPGAAS